MLFNSIEFLFVFLPVALLGFFALASCGQRVALAWLLLMSMAFYAWWNPLWLPLLLASIVGNLLFARWIATMPDAPAGARSKRAWCLGAAIAANLAVLVHYKYTDFILTSVSGTLGVHETGSTSELPLGISFFTFTQIAFLVDVYGRRARDFDPLRYGLFVTYFPHLIAGPILHHKEMMPQFARADVFHLDGGRLADGAAIFILGLFKKVVLADAFGRFADIGFGAPAGVALTFFEAWGAALSYTFQLYFDFSGYSDMAIGLALMIGITLPLNFASPYKAHNIADFWRRWHMTLSRFLRDYLYIPLGGNRRGAGRRLVNLMSTMLLGGLWHGAGWTYVAWGGLHGLYLVVHQAWRSWRPSLGRWTVPRPARPLLSALAWALTFMSVVVAWVFFRASDISHALSVLRGMAGLHGAVLPDQILNMLPWLQGLARGAGKVAHLADGTVMGVFELTVMLGLGLLIVLRAPAMHELSARTRLLLVVPCAALALQRVIYGAASPFLYFQF